MPALQHIRRFPPWRIIAILLLAFGLNALTPSGYMISAGAGGLPVISVCPETHPLARALTASREERAMHGGMAKDHAAMGHAAMDHPPMDHATMGHHSGDDGTAPATATASDGHCALAGAAKLALSPTDENLLAEEAAYAVLLGLAAIRPLVLRAPPHLRPPLRGPPPAI